MLSEQLAVQFYNCNRFPLWPVAFPAMDFYWIYSNESEFPSSVGPSHFIKMVLVIPIITVSLQQHWAHFPSRLVLQFVVLMSRQASWLVPFLPWKAAQHLLHIIQPSPQRSFQFSSVLISLQLATIIHGVSIWSLSSSGVQLRGMVITSMVLGSWGPF